MLGYSPFVSDEALIALINKATQFGTQNLIDVLIANSKLQPDVQSKINTLTTALKNQINTAIASAQTAPAASEAYHQQLRGKIQQRDILKGFLRSKYLSFDAYNNTGLDSTLSDMVNETRFSYKPQKLNLNLQKGNYTTANTILADINTQPGYGNYNTLMSNVIGLMQSGTGLYGLSQNTSNTAFTDSLAKDSTKIGYTIARALMSKVYGNLYNEVLIKSTPSGGGSRFNLENFSNNLQVMIFPNPASDILTLQMINQVEDKLVHIKVYDLLGQQKIAVSKAVTKSSIELPLGTLADGMYILQVMGEAGKQFTTKLIIKK
nr:T9SS type A sorting domain-containing protein [Bacteroidota bacterium]